MHAGRLVLLLAALMGSGCATAPGPLDRLQTRGEYTCRDGSINWHCRAY